MTATRLLIALALAATPAAHAGDGLADVVTLQDGCMATVEELPDSTIFQKTDSRLKGTNLVVVLKDARRTMVFSEGQLAVDGDGTPACWRVALGVDNGGDHPRGAKTRRGDRKTPEGWYRTSDKPWSNFAPAVAIHYPNALDARAGLTVKLVDAAQVQAIERAISEVRKPSQKTRLGGEILFHGGGSRWDWTWGCIAFDDEDNEVFRSLLPAGMRTNVLILP